MAMYYSWTRIFHVVLGVATLSAPIVRADTSGIISDDFNTFNLDPSVWTIVDPRADATIYVTGTNTHEARLNIGVPEGVRHSVDATGITAPRIMQSIEDTDFDIEVKFDSPLILRYQQQGVVIQEDDERYLRCDFYSDGSFNFMYVATILDGTLTPIANPKITAGSPMYLQVSRVGDDWTVRYSLDGTNWTTTASFEHPMVVTAVGPYAGNNGGTPPAFTSQIDYFVNLNAPLDPWDGEPIVDAFPPNLFSIRSFVGKCRVTFFWSTDEPADSRVDFGQTTDYEEGFVHTTDFTLHHAVTIDGLETDTTYHFRISSTDAANLTAYSEDLELTTTLAGGFISDDFNTFNLDPSVWTIIDPRADATFFITGTNTDESALNISVPEGVRHTVDGAGITAPRVMQDATDTDFGLEVKFNSPLTERYQQQGVLIEGDQESYLRSDFYSDGSYNYIYVATIENGTLTPIANPKITSASPMYLRVVRAGHEWTVAYSHNGSSWTTATAFEHPMVVKAVGPFVGNNGSLLPAHTTQIDYFFNLQAPIMAQDGGQVVDEFPPNLFSIRTHVEMDRATILWSTDEPADARVDYGLTTDYEEGFVHIAGLALHHTVTIEPLEPDATYHYRISSTDEAGLTAVSEDMTLIAGAAPGFGPVIDLWFGDTQTFGHLGIPQPDANIVGNVDSEHGLLSLYYRLNGGPQRPLSIGPNSRRLADAGDFNVDLAISELLPGSNELVIYAEDTQNIVTQTPVEVINASGPVWPLPYSIDWSTAGSIHEVAQVTDGLWAIEGDTVRTIQVGYDRLIALGDMEWQDYEITVPIRVHALDPNGYAAPSYGPAVGILLHWVGNSVDGSQPKQGIYPLGAVGIYRWQTNGDRFKIFGNNGATLASAPTSDVLQIGTEYIFKMRVEKLGSNFFYSLKVWPVDEYEPYGWKLEGVQADTNDPGAGSALLLAHHVDASFGAVHARPAPFDDGPEPIIINLQVTPSEDGALITWETNLPATSRVRFGHTIAYELGEVESTEFVTHHSVELGGLSMNTRYYFQAVSVLESGIGVASATQAFETIASCELDTDGDGVVDCLDGCPLDPDKVEPGLCGCGVPDTECTPLEFADWFDTGANNSLILDDSLFTVEELDGQPALTTYSTLANIHSHYVAHESWAWTDYEYTGRMLMTDPDGGIGVTVFSDYPNSDTYYRLRRHANSAFHVSPHPTGVVTMSGGTIDTGVLPVANVWYRFRVQVRNENGLTRVRAKVWQDGTPEPETWQADCYDDHGNRITHGTVGVWSMGPGQKYWAELNVTHDLRIFEVATSAKQDSIEISWITNDRADRRVDFGLTTDYELGSIEEAEPALFAHHLVLNGLEAGTEYHLRIVSVDSEERTAYREGLTITTAPEDKLIPDHWFDTQAEHSMIEDDMLFDAQEVDGETALSTTSTDPDIHSHFVSPTSGTWGSYVYMGRMTATDAEAGFGVTFLSDYPNTDAYYRLGSQAGSMFELTARPSVGSDFSGGLVETPIRPVPNEWYRFRIQLSDDGNRTTIMARVWPDEMPEPSFWQIHAHDTSPTRRTHGTVGVWASGPGGKFWDELAAFVPGGTPPPPLPPLRADFNDDGAVDAEDRDYLIGCLTGASIPQTNPDCLPPNPTADLDGDGDVDMTDFGLLMRCFSENGQPADPNCMN